MSSDAILRWGGRCCAPMLFDKLVVNPQLPGGQMAGCAPLRDSRPHRGSESNPASRIGPRATVNHRNSLPHKRFRDRDAHSATALNQVEM